MKRLNNPPCPRCGGDHVTKRGIVATTSRGTERRYCCKDCGRSFTDSSLAKDIRNLRIIEFAILHPDATIKEMAERFQLSESQMKRLVPRKKDLVQSLYQRNSELIRQNTNLERTIRQLKANYATLLESLFYLSLLESDETPLVI